jgi:hypothetical protein
VGFGDVPSLDVPDRLRRVATVSAGAEARFDEAGEHAVAGLRDKNYKRQNAERLAREDLAKFSSVVSRGRFGPKSMAQARQWLAIGRLGATDCWGLHGLHSRGVRAVKKRESAR